MSAPTAEGPPEVRRVLEAGRGLRESLAGYRAAFDDAARALGRDRGDDEPAVDRGFDLLRADWERTVAAFRQAVDRIGTAQKTLARGR